jgi:hypothetical protein
MKTKKTKILTNILKTNFLIVLILLTIMPFFAPNINGETMSNSERITNTHFLTENDLNFQSSTNNKESIGSNQLFQPDDYNWVPFDEEAKPGQELAVLPKSSDTMGICVDASFFGMYRKTVTVMNITFDILKIPGATHLTQLGLPTVPMVTRYLEIPQISSDGKHPVNIDVDVFYSDWKDLDDYNVYPAQEFAYEVENETYPGFQYDEVFYNTTNSFYPGDIATADGAKDSSMIFVRGHRLLALNLFPVRFNPVAKQVRVYTKIEVKLNYDQPAQTDPVSSRIFSPMFEDLLDNMVLNYEYSPSQLLAPFYDFDEEQGRTGAEYLIITHDNFYNAIVPLANWKETKGVTTRIVKTSDISAAAPPTAAEISDYIQDAYDTWSPAPSYVLLVGDSEFITTHYETVHPSDSHGGFEIATDLYYSTVHGEDYFPDIYLGRLSVDTAAQTTTIVNKILKYEQQPPADQDFYNNIAAAAYFQDQDDWSGPPWNVWVNLRDGYEDRRFVLTSEEIRDFLVDEGYTVERIYEADNPAGQNPTHYNDGPYAFYDDGDPLPDDLEWPDFRWDGDTDNITDIIESGCFLMYHRDHGGSENYWDHDDFFWGGSDGWGHPEYDTGDIATLTNGDLLPFVLSVECQCGWFDGEIDQNNDPALTHNTESFCEMFLRQAGGGAIAAIGSTRNSRSGYNDNLAKGFIDAIWPNFNTTYASGGLYKFGQILTYGKAYMSTIHGYTDDFVQPTFELFHLFGDPELSLWTSQPKELTVTHPTTIGSDGPQNFVVTVESEGTAVHHAKVCLQKGSDVYEVGYTDTHGQIIFEITPSTSGDMNITVTKHNYKPYQGSIEVTDNGATFTVDPSISYIGYSVTLEGNNFLGDEEVDIFFGGTTADTTVTASSGSFSVSFTVPSITPGDLLNVIAVGKTSGRTGVDYFKCLLEDTTCDPYIYSQWDSSTWHLNPDGGDPRWNNPEIQLYEKDTMTPVASNNLVIGTTYVIEATIYNNLDVEASGTDVSFEWAFWGAGQKDWNFIGMDTIDVPGSGSKTAQIDWTPSVTGHNCIKVTIDQYWDEDWDNNVGQENTHVQPVSSPAEISFTLTNPMQMPALIYLEATYLDGREMWPAVIHREYPQVIEPFQNDTVVFIIEVPDQIDEGTKGYYKIDAYLDDYLLGGIEVEVEKTYKPPPTTTTPTNTTTPTDTSTPTITIPIITIISSLMIVPVIITIAKKKKKLKH